MLEAETGLQVSFKTVDRAFTRLKITHKKTLVAREPSEERRTAFLNELQPYLRKPQQLVFLDESGFNTSMTRGHGLSYTLICAVSLAGPLAPRVIEGAMNGVTFEGYVREFLCPALIPGQGVVLDNLSSHHRA